MQEVAACSKWKYYYNGLKVLRLNGCSTFGEVMRAVFRDHVITKDFILVEGVPMFRSSQLVSSWAYFK